MGKLRARTDAELAARKQEIIDAARKLLQTEEYGAIPLATIAEKTSISRTSMYTYYEKKEDVFVDLMIEEYILWARDLETMEPQTREGFCRSMAELLWKRQTLLKLLSLQLSVWDRKYSDDMIQRFVTEVSPFYKTLNALLKRQFPDAAPETRNMFQIQFSVYCNSLYVLGHLPESQISAMEEQDFFGMIPDPVEICYEGLMLLSANL